MYLLYFARGYIYIYRNVINYFLSLSIFLTRHMINLNEINIEDLHQSYYLLKRAIIATITNYVLSKVKKSGLIQLTEHEYLHIDREAREIDLVYQKDGLGAEYLEITKLSVEDLFAYWTVIEAHPLKLIKLKPTYNAQLD